MNLVMKKKPITSCYLVKMSKAKWLFTGCTFICASYYGAWFLWEAMGWHWHTAANIPGFAMLLGAWPWSSAIYSSQPELQAFIGEAPRHFVTSAVVVAGFAFNVTLTYSALAAGVRRLSAHNKSRKADA